MVAYSWVCRCCGRRHEELPLSWGAPAPICYEGLSEDERVTRAQLADDFCVLDGEHFFIRGLLEIPIIGRRERFGWGVWTTLSKANYERVQRIWGSPDRGKIGPMFGWLSTSLAPFYPETLNLKTNVHLEPPPFIPSIEIQQPCDHPLAIEQRNGISMQRVVAIAETQLGAH